MSEFLLAAPSVGCWRMKRVSSQGTETLDFHVPLSPFVTPVKLVLLGILFWVVLSIDIFRDLTFFYLAWTFEIFCWYLVFSVFLSPSCPWTPLTLFCRPTGCQTLSFANSPQGAASPSLCPETMCMYMSVHEGPWKQRSYSDDGISWTFNVLSTMFSNSALAESPPDLLLVWHLSRICSS